MRYSREDYANGTPERVTGRETEYTTAVDSAELLGAMGSMPVFEGVFTTNTKRHWLKNGGVIYPDVGDLVEVATPECLAGREVELYARAGEHMVQSMDEQHWLAAGNSNVYGRVTVSKRSGYVNVRDSDGNLIIKAMSTGQHDNYYAPTIVQKANSDEFYSANEPLSSYLSTRGVWAGAGIVAKDGFRTTQKFEAMFFNGRSNFITHGIKVPYVAHEPTDRLEIRTGDGNMSSAVSIAVMDYTSLILRMIEHGVFPEELYVTDADDAMRHSSVPGRFIQTQSGPMTGVEHQRLISEAALEFAGKQGDMPKREIAAAQFVLNSCNDIAIFDGSIGTLEIIAEHAEWAAKLLYIRKHVGGKAVITAANLDAIRYDLRWEDVSPTTSPSRRWYAEHGDPFTEAEILWAYTQPPQTRALARTALLQSETNITSVSWGLVAADGQSHYLLDPFDDGRAAQ